MFIKTNIYAIDFKTLKIKSSTVLCMQRYFLKSMPLHFLLISCFLNFLYSGSKMLMNSFINTSR